MTVELICGSHTIEDIGGGAAKIVADFVRMDDLNIIGERGSRKGVFNMTQEQLDEFIESVPTKMLVKSLDKTCNPDDLLDIERPEVSWATWRG